MTRMTRVTVLALAVLALLSACTPSRIPGKGKQLGSYDYILVSEKNTHRYFRPAAGILNRSFVVLYDDDPRLNVRRIHQKTCTVSIDWARGFWSSSGWVDVRDLATSELVHTTHMRRGAFWAGAHEDVMEAINDVASARAAGPPLPSDARDSAYASDSVEDRYDARAREQPEMGRSKADRLRELNELRMQGLVTDPEYSRQRAKILDE